ncbi:cytochrome-c oxidase, cbb3-type subunit II [Algiphilus sp.]|uniref:cytochrome-c oxidase, cbb3-type subunit II n=1 Tax=Algiphilus sp. TaxID=1872431 RepID=UPI001CA6B08B|nr:cytochrome-c oxidase, cbb3-type subunit II [Algiphilus sp.]MBY8965847.1 cytochrome-c oxidase, cbb3-type subunit II [Algiphilus acroporae]MCI5061808.1 cytochrome-c oxidase, cbb3-type subunit II [Algiphilus sp.]MCI5104522.1 cytochrome-c oxidase, cbb3-type subunit II [Algiphilus sp.]
MNHEKVEKNIVLMAVLIALVISVGGFIQIVPLMAAGISKEPAPGVEPYSALRLAGRDVYVREGCYGCHSQMVRSLHEETLRYGSYSVAGEFVYDHPFQWGSKRTGPDLARVGGRYSDEWHRLHLINPRDLVPESNMPGYPWLAEKDLDEQEVQAMMRAMKRIGVPYTEEQIAAAPDEVSGKTKMDALIAYLQGLRPPQPQEVN